MRYARPYVMVILFNQGVLSFLHGHWVWLVALTLLGMAVAWSSKWLISVMGVWKGPWFPKFKTPGDPATRRRIIFVSISALVIVAFAYGYFLRPMMAAGGNLLPLASPHQGSVPYYDELNLVRLGWYLSPLGLFLACLGIILVLRQIVLKRQFQPLLLLLLLAAFLLFYGYKSRAFPDNYWVIRRYAVVTIPALLILAGLVIQRLHRLASTHPRLGARSAVRRILVQVCGSGLLVAMIATQTVAAWPFIRHRELGGSWGQIESLATRTMEADIILFEYGRAQEFFLGPLRNLFGQSVFPLAHDKPDPDSFDRVVGEYLAKKKRVFLIACDEWTSLESSEFVFEPSERFHFTSQLVERTYERLPEKMQQVHFSLQLYEIKPRKQGHTMPREALNRHSSFGYASRGFYQAELGPGGNTFRWSRGNSSVEMPEIDATYPAVLFARVARPDAGSATESPIRIRLNGHDLGPLRLSRRFSNYNIPIDRSQLAQGERNLVEFQSQTFNPPASGTGGDTRNLGFMLDSIGLQSLVPMGGARAYQVEFGVESERIQRTDFYAAEADGYSWTGSAPSLVWPVSLDPGKNYRLVIRAVKSNPDPRFRQFLTVWINDVKLDTRELIGVRTQFRNYTFAISREALDRQMPTIRMRVHPIWNPSLSGVSSDRRNLGCAIEWIRVEEL